METTGSLDDLEQLQTHPNHTIYSKALGLIEKFFSEEDNADPVLSAINQAQSTQATIGQAPTGGLFDL